MKKYTIVYGEWFNRGSMRSSLVRFDHVETDNLTELVKQEKYERNIWYIFDGHCKETED
jgi:hypothetical protein